MTIDQWSPGKVARKRAKLLRRLARLDWWFPITEGDRLRRPVRPATAPAYSGQVLAHCHPCGFTRSCWSSWSHFYGGSPGLCDHCAKPLELIWVPDDRFIGSPRGEPR